MSELTGFVYSMRKLDIVGSLWVDGSFMTVKIDPPDIDVALEIEAKFFDAISLRAFAFVQKIARQAFLPTIDSYFFCALS